MFINFGGIVCNADQIHSIRIVKQDGWDVEMKMVDSEVFLIRFNNEAAAHEYIKTTLNTLNRYPN